MEDASIVDLYWNRDEAAVHETEMKYQNYLMKIATNILYCEEDSMESVNDTYMKAWNSMPSHRPSILSTYLGKITRQISIDIFRKRNSAKRKDSQYALSLNELEECCSGGNTVEEQVELHELAASINNYLWSLSEETRGIFLCRYYYMDSIAEIAAYCSVSQSKVKSMLFRTRNGLKKHLEQEDLL